MTEGLVGVDADEKWQALQWPGATSTGLGRSTLQRASAWGQRGWKWQPGGGASGEGISPWIAMYARLLTSSFGASFNKAAV
jgi:hypothetical protein